MEDCEQHLYEERTIMHCRHHQEFHPECAACHHVRSTHLDADPPTRAESFDWLTPYTSALDGTLESAPSVMDLPALSDSSSFSDASVTFDSPNTDSSSPFDGFDGGSSGGGGASGDF